MKINMMDKIDILKREWENHCRGIKTEKPSFFKWCSDNGYDVEMIKLGLIAREQSSTYVSKSPKRNRRRERRQQQMREQYNL